MVLADKVRIARRFQRAIRIDADIGKLAALEGYICPRSSAEAIRTMARHVEENGQGAFTWTGPYGSGKSSLVVAMAAALTAQKQISRIAESVFDTETIRILRNALPLKTKGWRILPVVGRSDHPAQVIGESIVSANLISNSAHRSWTDKAVLDTVEEIAQRSPRNYGGLLIYIDEMGKFLEAAANRHTDIFLFQELAEKASRSGNRLIIVGILHQAFEEYAHRISRELRDEWSKVQGRFVDLAINTSGDEQIDLISRAIESDYKQETPGPLAEGVAAQTRRETPTNFARLLEDCRPLHPIVASLLGPISRRRFGQNQRSIFAFLNSAEPFGFQEFIQTTDNGAVYDPDRLWDYLRSNLEPAILASPDGHRWALAVDVLERCESIDGDDIQLRMLKVLALIGMFKDRSGLGGSLELLRLAFPTEEDKIASKLEELQKLSFVVYRKYSNTYSIYEGSDFDIELSVEQAQQRIPELNADVANRLFKLQPVVAKRHYHRTGALRWFDIAVVPLTEAAVVADEYKPRNGAIGCFVLTMPTMSESLKSADLICEEIVQRSREWEIVVGLAQQIGMVTTQTRELMALEWVREHTPELQGDRVARLEIQARIEELRGQLEGSFAHTISEVLWYRKGYIPQPLPYDRLNGLASDLADSRFSESPILHNELLVRTRLSSNAVAARNTLIRRMVRYQGEKRLGIDGYPPEGGLFDSLLESTGLYRDMNGKWQFVLPNQHGDDPNNLKPMWQAAKDLMMSNAHRAVPISEIYDVWREAPIGLKDGLMPVLAVAFFLSNCSTLAIYRNGMFQVSMSELDADFLVRDPAEIQLRWMELSETSRRLLSDLAEVVRDLDKENTLTNLEPLDVARGLVSVFDRLPPWVGRTQQLSVNAKRVRQLFKKANDPNRLIFDDMPGLVNDVEPIGNESTIRHVVEAVREGLKELKLAYPTMLNRLRDVLLAELRVPNTSPSMLEELRARAQNIRELGGDHRLEAFINRLAMFDGKGVEIEDLAGMAVNKPTRNWVDSDIDRATLILAEMAQDFNHLEGFARVKGRKDKRHSMAVVVDIAGHDEPVHDKFDVSDLEQTEVSQLIERVDRTLHESGEDRQNVILAALAQLISKFLGNKNEPKQLSGTKQRKAVS